MYPKSSSIRPALAARMTTTVAAIILGCALLVSSSGPAQARWPTPAAGQSASGAPEVLFTFDDGPHETYTAEVLDTLKAHGVHAIFFWVGRRVAPQGEKVDERRDLIHRAVREGHLVANHTVSHPNLCQIESAQAAHEIDANVLIFEEASGLPMLLFRAPYGAHCKRLEQMLADRSLAHMHWDIDPQEWSDHDAKRTAKYITNRLARLEGRAIVILHDTHKVTAKALPMVLEWLEEENTRRRERGDKPPIRILSGSDLIIERMDRGMLTWAEENTRVAAVRFEAAVSRLIP
jgi:peptidoglycan/xylan/chitin deacetylase (PgdA/CDA1 family)